jgi:hypothetical protein
MVWGLSMRRVAPLICGILLVACAKSPDSIAPAYVSDLTYRSASCSDLSVEYARVNGALVTASAQQEQARGNDTVGIILLGLPVSSLSGDNIAPQVAELKGELEAIHRVALEKKCMDIPEPKQVPAS